MPAAFLRRAEGIGLHQDPPVPARRSQRRRRAGAAAGATPRPMGRAVCEGMTPTTLSGVWEAVQVQQVQQVERVLSSG